MVHNKAQLVCVGVVMLVAAVVANRGSAQTYSQTASYEDTARYLLQVGRIIEQASQGDPTPQSIRRAASRLRAIPTTGVDRQAVMLTRRTADWFDNAASLAEKREALNAAAFRGGFHVGRMLASNDESEQAAGVVGGILLLVVGLASESQMEQDVQSLGTSLEKLQADWQSYLNKLQRGALP